MDRNPQKSKCLVRTSSSREDVWFRVEQAVRFGDAIYIMGWVAPTTGISLWRDGKELELALVRRPRGDVARGLRQANPDMLGFVAFAWSPSDPSISIPGQVDPPFPLVTEEIDILAGELPLRPQERSTVARVIPKGTREQALVLGHVDLSVFNAGDDLDAEAEVAQRHGERYLDLSFLAKQARNADSMSWTPPPLPGQPLQDWYFDNWRSTEIDPRPEFSVRFYLETNADVRESGAEPFGHYVLHGHAEGRRPHPLIFPDFVAAQHDVGPTDVSAFFQLFSRPVWLNPLMRRAERLTDVTLSLQDRFTDARRFFAFDYDAWISKQHDVLEDFPQHPIYHLFEYGLAESRLSASEGIDRRLLFQGGRGRGSDLELLRTLDSPIENATLRLVVPPPPGACQSRLRCEYRCRVLLQYSARDFSPRGIYRNARRRRGVSHLPPGQFA